MDNQINKKSATRWIALLLAAVLLLSSAALIAGCSCRSYRRKTFDYNSVQYSRPDWAALESAFANANSKLSGNANSAIIAINSAVGKMNDLIGDYQYVNLEYSKNTADEFYKAEYIWINEKFNESRQMYFKLLYNMLNSKHKDTFFQGWSQEEIQMIIDQNQAMDDEYLALQNAITALQTQYNEIDAAGEKEFADEAAVILVGLIENYNKLAAKSGYSNYMEYAYANDFGRSYTTSQSKDLCDSVKQYISPIINDVANAVIGPKQAQAANAAPASSTDYIADASRTLEKYFGEIDNMSEAYAYMNECNLHYKATAAQNPNGVSGAFTTFLYNFDAPYIYQFCKEKYTDIGTFVHEFGHFTSYYINGSEGGSDLDVAEIQSQANEMLFMPYWSEMFGAQSGEQIVKSEIFSSLYWSVIMGCILDEFQREIYTSPALYSSADAINGLFDELLAEYNADEYGALVGGEDYDFTYWWAEVSHTFMNPFYYISYAVSALPALTIYEDSCSDRAAAIAEYNYIMEYGNGTYEFKDLLQNAGVDSPFNPSTIKSLADFISAEVVG